MCRGKQVCSVLGNDPGALSREAPLPPPQWFQGQAELLALAARQAAEGDVQRARETVTRIRSDDLRARFVEHAQISGRARLRLLHGELPDFSEPQLGQKAPRDTVFRRILERDGWHCRYCGIPVVHSRMMQLLEDVLGERTFHGRRAANARMHGAAITFRASPDHVVPSRDGGDSSEDNIVTACWSCNFGKHSFSLEDLGLDDPRDRPPVVVPGWDGLQQHTAALKKIAKTVGPAGPVPAPGDGGSELERLFSSLTGSPEQLSMEQWTAFVGLVGRAMAEIAAKEAAGRDRWHRLKATLPGPTADGPIRP